MNNYTPFYEMTYCDPAISWAPAPDLTNDFVINDLMRVVSFNNLGIPGAG